MKTTTRGRIEDAIPEFLGLTRSKCRFILKRIPDPWKGVHVELKEIDLESSDIPFDSLVSLGRNEIDHSNHELFTCSNPFQMYFCFESSSWALINRV